MREEDGWLKAGVCDRERDALAGQRLGADAIAARGRSAPDRLDWPVAAARHARGPYAVVAAQQSVFERKPAPDLIRGGHRFALRKRVEKRLFTETPTVRSE